MKLLFQSFISVFVKFHTEWRVLNNELYKNREPEIVSETKAWGLKCRPIGHVLRSPANSELKQVRIEKLVRRSIGYICTTKKYNIFKKCNVGTKWHYIDHHHCVLPKSRSLIANSGTKAAVLQQTEEPRFQFYKEWIGAVAARYIPHPILSLASGQTLKDQKRSQWPLRGGEESEFG